jgi:transposase InsO family protein
MSSGKVLQRTGEDIMHRRGQKTTFQERIVISELAEVGHSDPEIAAYLGCSVWTVRKWRRIFERKGRDGLTTQMGRPVTGVLSTMPPELQTKLRTLRKAHPGWGPESLLATLRADPAWSASHLPSRSRVAAYLKQEGLTRKYQRHVDLPQPPPQAAQAPHEEWQMDAQGVMKVDGVGKVSVINVVDVVSRLKVESCPRAHTSKPAAADYYVTLRRAFLTYGLPKRLSLDHDTVFFDNTSPSPFPTRLHLWLLGLGIDLVFTRVRRPTDHASVERTHQTMTSQALLGQTYASPDGLWAGLDQRRAVLNQFLPIRALHRQAPLQAYPQAVFSGRAYRPEWEEALFDLQRIYQYLAQGRWFRYNNKGSVRLGTYDYYLDYHYDKQTMEITFDASQVAFVCQPEVSKPPIVVAARGLTKADLMGDLAILQQLPIYQLALPFFPQDQRRLALLECLHGMAS